MTSEQQDNALVAAPTEPSYLITFAVQKVGDTRVLQVQNVSVTVALCARNPVVPELIKCHMNALAQHDAGQLTETTREAEGLPTGKPN